MPAGRRSAGGARIVSLFPFRQEPRAAPPAQESTTRQTRAPVNESRPCLAPPARRLTPGPTAGAPTATTRKTPTRCARPVAALRLFAAPLRGGRWLCSPQWHPKYTYNVVHKGAERKRGHVAGACEHAAHLDRRGTALSRGSRPPAPRPRLALRDRTWSEPVRRPPLALIAVRGDHRPADVYAGGRTIQRRAWIAQVADPDPLVGALGPQPSARVTLAAGEGPTKRGRWETAAATLYSCT